MPDTRRTIVATEQFDGAFGVADIVISYRDENDQFLRRPLIVAEGFDPGWITSPEEPEGQNTFARFIRDVRNSQSQNLRNLISGNPLVVGTPSDYDLVYVNWRKGTDWLQRNALVLEEVIREVNRLKRPDLTTGLMNPNVVLGSSMGGVIARMALGRMDRGGGQNGAGGFAAHQTRLYVSLDAPHQGANVPLGYQAAARHATRMYVSTGRLAAAVEIIQLLRNGPSPLLNLLLADQPASKQMLTNRIDVFYNPANATNQQFLQELRIQWAYPNPNNTAGNVRSIAISNGSECAIDQEYAAGSSLLYHYRSTKTRFMGDLLFMAAGAGLLASNLAPVIAVPLVIPGSNKFELTLDIKSIANGGGNAVYYGNVKLTKKVLWLLPFAINIANKTYNAPSGLLPLDTYPGGFYTLELKNQPGSVSQDWMFSYNNSFYIQRRFSFIPTTSSLDIGQGNTALTNANYLARYVGAAPPAPPFNTPFANFATAFNQNGIELIFDNNNLRRINNEPHEGLFIRNANFLANEMNGINNLRTNCEAFCANGTITGNTTICTNQTLTAPFGNGVNYNWTVGNTSLVTLTPNGNTVLVERSGTANGQTTITVNISGACGNIDLTATINVGTVITGYYTINSNYHQPLQRQLFTNNSPIWLPANQYFGVTAVVTGANLTSNTWNRDASSYPFSWSTSGTTLNFSGNAGTTPYTQRNGIFSLTAQNVCGTATQNFLWPVIVSSTSFRVAASPNPVSSSLNISFSEQNEAEITSKQQGQELKPQRSIKSTGRTIITLFEFNTSLQVKQWTQNETSSKGYNYSVAGLRKGLYVLQVDRNNQTATTKIIVE